MTKKASLTMPKWIAGTMDHLRALESADKRVSHICSMHHGFEGWLKFEMAALLCRTKGYRQWIGDVPGDVGLEYRAVLAGRETKLVDLWASPFKSSEKTSAKEWHFVELKVAFNNANANKQFASWRADFELLRTMDRRRKDQRPCSLASLVFGVGFDKDGFLKASTRACEGLSFSVAPVLHEVATRPTPLFVHALVEEVH